MLRSGAPPPAPPPRPTPPPPPPPLQQPAPTPAASKAFAKANAAASSATHENTSGAGWVGLLKLVGQSPALVSCTPKLLRHQRVLRPHASALLPHMEKLGKHLPRMLDQMDALGPHLSNIIPMLPELMPHFDALLDVLPAIESELPMVIAHREALMPSLPYIVPQLTAMRPYIGQLVAKTAQLAPHTALLASHLHTIIPHLAVVVLHLDALAPHLDALLQEETLRSLLANADHVAARLRLLGPKLPALLPPGTPGGGDLLITSLLAGSDEDAAGVLSRAQTTAAPAAGAGKEGGAGFIGSLKRMFVKEVLGEEPSPKGAAHEPDIPRINAQAELVKERLNGIEREFRSYKERAVWVKQQQHVDALKISKIEEHMFDLEDEAHRIQCETAQIEKDVKAEELRVGDRALRLGRQRKLVNRGQPTRADTVLGGLLSLHRLNL